jgi:hypothetical protein
MCRIENQTRKHLIFGARRGHVATPSELKNPMDGVFNKLLVPVATRVTRGR